MKYEYAAIYFVSVTAFATPKELRQSDSYFTDDAESRAYFRMLEEGFRWVRTDGDWAIFEREVDHDAST